MGKGKEHWSDRPPTAKRPSQINSSPEAGDAKMPFKDSRLTIRIGEQVTKLRLANDILDNGAEGYFNSRERVILDDEYLPSPASIPHLLRSNYENRVQAHPLPLSEENLRKLEKSTESKSTPGAYMRKRGSPTKKDKRKEKEDRNSHPLNLPPEELRRLSAAIARAESVRGSMDVDGSDQNGVTSPPAQSPPVTPAKATPGTFPENTNGVSAEVNGKEDKSPTPPPHRSPMKPPVDAEACKAAGNKFFKAKDYLRAVTEYTKAVDAEPMNPTYPSNRAAAYMGANKFEPALADSIRANELDPNNPKIIIRLARIYTSLGRPKEALATYALIPGGASEKDTFQARQMAQALDAAEAAIKSGKGGGQKALWDMDQAANFLGSSVSRPRKWQLLRADAFLMNGDANSLGEVQGITTSLMRDNPTDAEALVLRGRAFYQAGENEQAIKHFRQALSFDPDLTQARTLLKTVQKLAKAKEAGNAAFNAKRFSEAVKLYTEALEVDPTNKGTNAKLYQNRATARIKIKEYDEAVSDCEQALKLDPSYMKARRTRAKALGESGDWTQAVKELNEIAEQYPEEPNIKKDVRNAELELKKSTRKDYYKILGVEKDATENEINKAYKKLSIRYHPDKNPNDPSAEDKFKDLGEAKDCLLDPQKRERYDSGADLIDPSEMFAQGRGGMPFGGMGGGGGGGGGVQIDPEMLFNMMGGMGGPRGGGGGGMPHFQFSAGGPGGRGGYPF